jgi:hypothetical protein
MDVKPIAVFVRTRITFENAGNLAHKRRFSEWRRIKVSGFRTGVQGGGD